MIRLLCANSLNAASPLLLMLLLLPVKLMAQQSKEQLSFDPKLVIFDTQKDSIYRYLDTPRKRRLFKPAIAETHVLLVEHRNVGIWHHLYDYDGDAKQVLQVGIRDIFGRVYWIDNKSKILTVYQDEKILWTYNFDKRIRLARSYISVICLISWLSFEISQCGRYSH